MSTPPPVDLAARALDSLDGAGWVTVAHERSASVVLPRGGQLRTSTVDRTEVTFTAWRDGHLGSATTSAVDGAALAAAARRAIRAADATAAGADGPGDATPPPEPAAVDPSGDGDEETAAAEAADGLAAVQAVRAAAGDTPVAARWVHGAVTRAVAASTGLVLGERTTDAHLRVRTGAGGVRAAMAAESAQAAGALDAGALARRALGRIPGGEWHDPTAGEQTIVLTPEAVAAILDVAGPLVFDGLASADGRTRADGRLATAVGSALVHLIDDPTDPGTLPRAFDASGTPKRPLRLVDAGVLASLVHDGRSRTSTGHATSPGGDARGPRPTNLVLAGGDAADLAALVAGVDVGLLVTSIGDLRPINAELGLAYGIAAEGTSRIVDGEVAGAAGSVPLLVSPLDVLAGVEALTTGRTLVGSPTRDGARLGHGILAPALRTTGGIVVTD
ncbi:metallopeptidase TldD-related protein [Patulibacter sp.]|uniref:metallopeptidase TldD-related protein n=1 Tax=Patulibacter sp. TaxID=1912859 RepID=UPI002721B702|nr:metallopeptidase TldD-related protein [Patulibacter sp.]MDO9409502.1 metallopeptidase TldD-related protein [Patulibacter sp.]